ncbi:MAG: proprotein convertase P-domain-containing protein, partial [Xanthomonadales bacterium]|nr:proprotein convertase P-domain-containing protein [Xanthomonadales bacterium]
MENPTYRTPRRLALSLLLAAALVPAAHGQSKDEAHAQMIDLQAQIAALKGQSSVEAQQQLAALASQLHDLSASLGGDLPCATGELSAGGGSAPAGGPPLPTGCTTTTTNFTQSTAVAIPAGPAVVSSTLDVSGVDTYLWDLNITTGITHTFPGDLDITITSPAGTVVTLTTDNAGTNDDVFNGTVWDDSANPGGQVPYTSNNGLVTDQVYVSGTLASPLVPEESLAAFVGEDPNGTWTLTISDDTGGDAGNLSSWTLAVSTFPQAPNLDPVASFDQATAVAIPAGPAVVSSDLVVSGLTNPICKVELRSAVRHTFPGDLDVTLTSPDGIIVTLTTDNAGTNDDVFNGTVWRDDANPAGQVPYTTNNGIVTDQVYAISTLASPLVVEESLGAFMGFDGNGTWTLTVSDDSGGDAGSVDSWGLDFTTCSCAINADLSITKTDGVASAVAGSTTTYTIVASNAGPADAIGATVADSFPAACTSVSWT